MVTSEEILAVVETDAEWLQRPADVRTKMRSYVTELPTLLADYLPRLVTLKGVIDAKIVFLRYCLDHGIVAVLVEEAKKNLEVTADMAGGSFFAAASEFADLFDPTNMLQSALELALEQLQGLAFNLEELLEVDGLTDRDVLTRQLLLSGEALVLYDHGTLTFADLLRLQPMVIIHS